jgi:hypothetical protein
VGCGAVVGAGDGAGAVKLVIYAGRGAMDVGAVAVAGVAAGCAAGFGVPISGAAKAAG